MSLRYTTTEQIMGESTRRIARKQPVRLPVVPCHSYLYAAMLRGVPRPSDDKLVRLEYTKFKGHTWTSLEAWTRFLCRFNSATSQKQRARIERMLKEKPFWIGDKYWSTQCAERFGAAEFKRSLLRDWCNRGLTSRKNGPRIYLEHFKVGRKTYTSIAAVIRFYDRLQRSQFKFSIRTAARRR